MRAFAPGEGTGDSGEVLSLELRFLPPEAWFGRIRARWSSARSTTSAPSTLRHDPAQQLVTKPDFVNRISLSGWGFGASLGPRPRLRAAPVSGVADLRHRGQRPGGQEAADLPDREQDVLKSPSPPTWTRAAHRTLGRACEFDPLDSERPMKTRRRSSPRASLAARRAFALHPLCAAALLAMSGGGLRIAERRDRRRRPGDACRTRSPTQQVVTQGSAKAIIDWRGSRSRAGEKVRFDQPSSSAVLLNRVTGYDPSRSSARCSRTAASSCSIRTASCSAPARASTSAASSRRR